jgi:hypothetical protein
MFSNYQWIYLFHILIVAPLLIYLGMCQCAGDKCNKVIKRIAFAFGVTVFIYHIYKLYYSYQKESYVTASAQQGKEKKDGDAMSSLPSTFEHSYTPEKYSEEIITKDLGYTQP